MFLKLSGVAIVRVDRVDEKKFLFKIFFSFCFLPASFEYDIPLKVCSVVARDIQFSRFAFSSNSSIRSLSSLLRC